MGYCKDCKYFRGTTADCIHVRECVMIDGIGEPTWFSPREEEEIAEMVEMVNHPDHYNRENGMECLEEMLLLYPIEEVMIWCKLNVHKYRYRAYDKNGLEDIQKSDWYLKKYKELKQMLNSERGRIDDDWD